MLTISEYDLKKQGSERGDLQIYQLLECVLKVFKECSIACTAETTICVKIAFLYDDLSTCLNHYSI